jgi:selenocysteine-specific elongation factor
MIVGTAGHIDHGKTALVRALTGVDADRLPEEKARGITIDIGFAYQRLGGDETLGFVDVPGHERFVHNMLAGAIGIDYVLLVVAADDGPMPQTREHLQILDLLDLRHGIVALSKADLVPPERLSEVADQMRALLSGTGLADADILPVSSVTGAGVPELGSRLSAAAASLPRRSVAGRFRMAVDRSFSLAGVGTVVTGTVFAGQVAIGDRLLLSPSGIEARVRGIHAQNEAADHGRAGQRCAVNIAGPHLDKDRIQRGHWLVDPAAHGPTDRFDARIRLLSSETRPLRHWTPVHLHLGAAHVSARVALLDVDALPSGETALAQIVADRPLGALRGDKLILRDQSAQRTIGGGVVLDPWPPARGRRKPVRLASLRALERPTAAAALKELIDVEPGWIDLSRYAQMWNLTEAEAAGTWREAGLTIASGPDQHFGFSTQRCASVCGSVVETLGSHHAKSQDSAGLEAERLRLATPVRMPPAVFSAVLGQLLRDHAIEADGPWLRLPGHAVKLTAADERLWSRIRPLMQRGRFQPPRVRDYADTLAAREDDVRQLLRRLAKMGQVIQVAHDHFFLRSTVVEMIAIADGLATTSADRAVAAGAFRDKIGSGRKVAIQILEFFDRAGVTVRHGDLRTVRREKLDRFGAPGSLG